MSDLLNTGPDEPRDQERLEATRRAQFEQVNASLALEGMAIDQNDLEIQEKVAAGELTHDQAVAMYVAMSRTGAA